MPTFDLARHIDFIKEINPADHLYTLLQLNVLPVKHVSGMIFIAHDKTSSTTLRQPERPGSRRRMAVKENGVLMNGSVSKQVPPRARSQPSASVGWSWTSFTLRLALWYLLITCIFRCPTDPSSLDESSPRVCRPYLKSITYVQPYVEPYYQAYASPYVDKARPYVEQAHRKFVAPASQIGLETYRTVAAPRIDAVKQYGQDGWQKILPQAQAAQKKAIDVYDQSLSSYVEDASSVITPYYSRAKDGVVDIHQAHIVPALERSTPFLLDTYSSYRSVFVGTVVPYIRWVWSSTIIFVDGTLWPQVSTLYGDNVRPQIDLVSDRLFRYQEGRKLKESMEVPVSEVETTTVTVSESSTSAPTPTKLTAQEQMEAAREQVAKDLREWQANFARAADKGSEDLHERVSELVQALVHSHVDQDGKRLFTALDETVTRETDAFKAEVRKSVSELSEDSSKDEIQQVQKDFDDSLRQSGLQLRQRASALREWNTKFEGQLISRAESAAAATVDVLNGIRDLGLQQIGMRWAWMDGITYKDWQKYHQIKKQLDSWRDEVREVATKHEAIDSAKVASGKLLDDAMLVAQQGAQELVRLRDVAKWKIQALDATDNFESRKINIPIVSNIASKVEEAVEQVKGSSSETKATESPLAEQVPEQDPTEQDAVEQDAAEVTPQSETPRKVFGGAMAQKVKAREPIYDDVIEEAASFSEKVQSVVNDAGDRYAEVSKAVSEALLGRETGTAEKVASVASEKYSSALAAASEALYSSSGAAENVADQAADKYQAAVSAASMAIYGTPTPASESIASQAKVAYAEAVAQASSHYAQARSIVSAKVSGTPKPVHEQMLSSVEAAYSGSLELASQKLDNALALASEKFSSRRPTSNPLDSISSVAAANLQAALSLAQQQYSDAKAAVGATPTPAHQQYLSDAQQKYYAAMGLAHERYSDFVGAASSAVYGTSAPAVDRLSSAASEAVYGTPTPTLSSLSSAMSEAVYGTSDPAYKSAISAASSGFAAATGAAESQLEAALEAAQAAFGKDSAPANLYDDVSVRYESAMSAASSTLSEAANSASVALYGSTGVAESAASRASENWEALVSKASEQIYGAPTPVFGSVTSKAGEQFAEATNAAAEHFANVQALFSELVVGHEPDFTQSVMDRLSSAYSGGASSASSLASAASSMVSSYVAPPEIESILQGASDNLQAIIDAASSQVYGTQKGTIEQATSSAAEAYAAITEAASVKLYGSQTGYAEAAQSSVADALANAQAALNNAIYGTPTGKVESATAAAKDAAASAGSAAQDAAASISSAVNEGYSAAAAKVSEAVYGPEQGALESARARLASAVEGAQTRLSELAAAAAASAQEGVAGVQENVESLVSSASRIRDEL